MSNQPSARRDWFAVERRVFDDEMFVGDEFSRRDAWLWLIANAARRDHSARTRGGMIRLERGDVIVGREHLAKVWKWTPSRVRTFLNQLAEAKRIKLRQSDGHHPTVAQISNYGRFQDFEAPVSPVKSPADRQSVASRSPHPYKEQVTKGNSRATPTRKRIGALAEEDGQAAEGAIEDYNHAAAEIGFARCGVTDSRCTAVARRLLDIGKGDIAAGRERFREALSAIPHWSFLAGREKPKPGLKPFRLDLDRLLSTGSGMGDVLAKLLDLHAEHGAAESHAASPLTSSSCHDAWREAQAEELAAQRARFELDPTAEGGAPDAVH